MTDHAWILFDGACPLCRRWTARLRPHARRRGFRCAALQRPAVCRRLALDGPVPDEFKLLLPDGRILGGADAALHIAGAIEWVQPLTVLARAFGLCPALRALYRTIARRRHCHVGVCALPTPARYRRKRAFDAAWVGALTAAFAARRTP